ncbi:MAG: DUF4340 domain-containing protein [Patescibacteria group bacterium]
MKKNLTLIIILIVLVIGAYLYTGSYQNWQAKKQTADSANWLVAVDMSLVDRIETQDKDGKTYVIKKENNLWLTEPDNWPTEKIIMDALEEKLAELTKANLEVVSFNKDNKSNFEIGDNGLRVKLFQNDAEAGSFIMGKIASDYSSTYIGREGDDRTYRAPITFVRAFDTESWRDRTIFNLSSSGIDVITWRYQGQTIVINNLPDKRGEIYWHASSTLLRLNKEKVDGFLNSVTKLEASDVPEQTTAGTGLDKPALQLRLQGQAPQDMPTGQGIDETLIIGNKNQTTSEYWLQKKSSGQIFLITEMDEKILAKNIKDFY